MADKAAQIKEFKELLDAGTLTQEEFEAERKNILNTVTAGSDKGEDTQPSAPGSAPLPEVQSKFAKRLEYLRLAPVRYRRIILLFFACLVAPFTGYQISRLAFDAHAPSILPPHHPIQRINLDNAMFGTSPLDAVETAHIVWGLSPEALDLTGVNSLRNTTYDGRPLIDSSFMIDGNATRHVMNACAILRGSALVREAPDLAEGGTGRMVQCWPEAFGEWRTARGLSFPVEDATEATEALLQWLSAEGKKWAQDVGFRSLDDGNQELTYVKIRADTKLKLILNQSLQRRRRR